MTPEQRLERIAEWAAAEPSVSGLIVVGSRARTSTPADAFSDIDIVLVCREPERFITDDRWVEAFGTPVLTFVELTALRDRQERRVLYEDGGNVDLVPITEEDAESVLASSAARYCVTRMRFPARFPTLTSGSSPGRKESSSGLVTTSPFNRTPPC
jgi:predicted nucleotidyltransferase